MNKYILLYMPPCGNWYVHSHKIYPSEAAAIEAAKKFIAPGTLIAVYPIIVGWIASLAEPTP